MSPKALWASVLAAVCLQSCSATRSAVPDTGHGVTVVSFNVRTETRSSKDGPNAWDLRKEASPAMIAAVKPDVVGLQEASDAQVRYIEDNCPGYAWYGVGREDGRSKGEHMAILYNTATTRMLRHGTYWLSETPDVPSKGWDAACRRTATWALMKDRTTGRTYYVVNTHLDHRGAEARRRGLALVEERIASMNSDRSPLILMGDLNVTPGDECLSGVDSTMKSARVHALLSDDTPSFNGWHSEPLTVIDYIYYTEFGTCSVFKVLTDRYAGKPFISDHYPIMARFSF